MAIRGWLAWASLASLLVYLLVLGVDGARQRGSGKRKRGLEVEEEGCSNGRACCEAEMLLEKGARCGPLCPLAAWVIWASTSPVQ